MSLWDIVLYIELTLSFRLIYSIIIYCINANRLGGNKYNLVDKRQYKQYLKLTGDLEINFVQYIFSIWKWTTKQAIKKEYHQEIYNN